MDYDIKRQDADDGLYQRAKKLVSEVDFTGSPYYR
jgi:hypothetical protein